MLGQGAQVADDCLVESLDITAPDCLQLGQGSVISEGVTVQCHTSDIRTGTLQYSQVLTLLNDEAASFALVPNRRPACDQNTSVLCCANHRVLWSLMRTFKAVRVHMEHDALCALVMGRCTSLPTWW